MSFAQAAGLEPAPRVMAPVPGDGPAVVDPRTGELLDLADQPHEQLVEVLLEVRRRASQLKAWRETIEAELISRQNSKRIQIVGDWEVLVERTYRRQWDPDDLEATVTELVGRGALTRKEVAGLISMAPKVDGHLAAALLSRVYGDDHKALEACFQKVESARPKVTVTPVVSLEPNNSERRLGGGAHNPQGG